MKNIRTIIENKLIYLFDAFKAFFSNMQIQSGLYIKIKVKQ